MSRSLYQQKSINGDIIPDSLIVEGDLTVTGDTHLEGNLLVDGTTTFVGPVILPTNNFAVKRYVSDAITQAALIAGSATQAINLAPAFPTNVIPLGTYSVTSLATTSSSADTTGLLAEIGPAADPNGYATSTSIFGAASRKETVIAGVMQGCLRLGDTPQILLTATGVGAEDLGDIDQLSVKVVIYYLETATE